MLEILLGIAGAAFTAWAGVVLWVGRRVVNHVDKIQERNAGFSERLTRIETVVAPGIPPESVKDALADHEARVRTLERHCSIDTPD